MVREFSIVQSTDVGHCETVQKNFGSSLKFFFAKSARRCFIPVTEIKPKTLVLNETSTQTYSLSKEDFGYNHGRLKSSGSHACC